MSVRKHAHLFRDISHRAFQLHLKDIDTLRNKYANNPQVDIGRIFVFRMKRPQLINAILAVEYGAEVVMDYISQCKEWDEFKPKEEIEELEDEITIERSTEY